MYHGGFKLQNAWKIFLQMKWMKTKDQQRVEDGKLTNKTIYFDDIKQFSQTIHYYD